MNFRSVRALVRFIMRLIADLEIVGAEKLPPGNLLLAANHLGFLDTAVLLAALDRQDIILVIAEKYRNHPLFGLMGRSVDAVWLNRNEADFSALRAVLARMKKGGLMVIAPEGTRSRSGALQQGKMGVAYLALKSGYPIVPVTLTGTEDARVVENLKHFRKSRIRAVAGEPIIVSPATGSARADALRQATDEVMCRLALQLPESQRGFYAAHSRLIQLLAEKRTS